MFLPYFTLKELKSILWTTVRKSKTVNGPLQSYVDISCDSLLQNDVVGRGGFFEHPYRKTAVYFLTVISAFPAAQPLLWQLSLTCCHGTELDALWQQHLVEYGESLPTLTHSWQTRQVRLIELFTLLLSNILVFVL